MSPAGRLLQQPWDLWYRQAKGVLRLELRRQLISRGSMVALFFAGAPVLMLLIRSVVLTLYDLPTGLNRESHVLVGYAIIYRNLFLRLTIFFGCLGVFVNLFRGEVMERTLHYYLLTPIRREVLVTGKYLAGVLLTFLFFGLSTVLSYLLLLLPPGRIRWEDHFLNGPGLEHLATYVGITLFACIGYGSFFLVIGLLFKNPIIPGGLFLGWESLNFLLPPLLKKFSVIYYVESLCPVAVPQGEITVFADPAPAWLSVPGLFTLTILVLVAAVYRVRRTEIRYDADL